MATELPWPEYSRRIQLASSWREVVPRATPILMDDQILSEALDAAIIVFGGGGKNFGDEKRFENIVLLVARSLRFATYEAAVGIGKSLGSGDMYA